MLMPQLYTRRVFLGSILGTAAGITAAPAILVTARPRIPHGVASGDVTNNSAVLWSRCDRAARMLVEWSTTESGAAMHRVKGPRVTAASDYTGKLSLRRLPPGQRIIYRVQFQGDDQVLSEPQVGQFTTPADERRDVFFAWSGDTCGQGYGIDESRGGMVTHQSVRRLQPDFFIHSGDTIYADIPLKPEVKLPDGSIWKNIVTPEKSKVAETLAEFYGNHRYNLLDAHARALRAEVPVLAQWDDHEVRNNWFPGQVLTDAQYKVKDVDILADHGRRAFLDYWPVRPHSLGRIFRRIPRGPLCDVFLLDMRSYRGPNTTNRQSQKSDETAFLGQAQLQWLKAGLRRSTAQWKIIASDMPIGLVVADGKNYENCANGHGPPLGRELEIAELLQSLRQARVRNVIWLTADVHYAASHHYHPDRAQFKEFDPFWEFVSGPLHAASLGPGALDNTFGPEVRFTSRPKGAPASGPYSDQQFFSTVRIAGGDGALTVAHHNRDGERLWETSLTPEQER